MKKRFITGISVIVAILLLATGLSFLFKKESPRKAVSVIAAPEKVETAKTTPPIPEKKAKPGRDPFVEPEILTEYKKQVAELKQKITTLEKSRKAETKKSTEVAREVKKEETKKAQETKKAEQSESELVSKLDELSKAQKRMELQTAELFFRIGTLVAQKGQTPETPVQKTEPQETPKTEAQTQAEQEYTEEEEYYEPQEMMVRYPQICMLVGYSWFDFYLGLGFPWWSHWYSWYWYDTLYWAYPHWPWNFYWAYSPYHFRHHYSGYYGYDDPSGNRGIRTVSKNQLSARDSERTNQTSLNKRRLSKTGLAQTGEINTYPSRFSDKNSGSMSGSGQFSNVGKLSKRDNGRNESPWGKLGSSETSSKLSGNNGRNDSPWGRMGRPSSSRRPSGPSISQGPSSPKSFSKSPSISSSSNPKSSSSSRSPSSRPSRGGTIKKR